MGDNKINWYKIFMVNSYKYELPKISEFEIEYNHITSDDRLFKIKI